MRTGVVTSVILHAALLIIALVGLGSAKPLEPEVVESIAVDLVPMLKESSVTAAWAGYIDSTPDGVPAIGEVAEIPGFILAAGFSGHGFGIGPGAGHLIADLVTGAKPICDPSSYRPDRFRKSAWGKVADF